MLNARQIMLRVFLCAFLFAFVSVPASWAIPISQQTVSSYDLVNAAAQGLISYEARGRGAASGAMIDLSVTNLSDGPLAIHIQPGTRFVPIGAETTRTFGDEAQLIRTSASPFRDNLLGHMLNVLVQGGGQGAVATGGVLRAEGQRFVGKDMPAGDGFVNAIIFGPPGGPDIRNPEGRQTIALQQNQTQSVVLEGYCTNAHLPNPSPQTRYIAQPPGEDDLTRLVNTSNRIGRRVSIIALQIATWILTDDVDLSFLESVGYSPSDAELWEALTLLEEAGIDISDKQMGQIEKPAAPPESAIFAPGQTTAVHVRGTVVGTDGEGVASALVFLMVEGPEHSQLRLDITSGRGRFDAIVDLFESDTVTLVVVNANAEAGRLIYTAHELYDLFAEGAELVIMLVTYEEFIESIPQPEITPEASTPSIEVPEGFMVTSLNPVRYGLRLRPEAGNVRGEPSTSADVVRQLRCGEDIAALDAQTIDADGRVWYHVQVGGWVREDIVRVFASLGDAEAAANTSESICNPVPPTATPPPNTPSQPNQDPNQAAQPSGGENPPIEPPPPPPPSGPFNVTIINNAPCAISGSFGPAGFSVAAGGSTTVSVPGGTHTASGSGDCGTVGPTQYNINGDAEWTIG